MSVDQFIEFQINVNNAGVTKQGFFLIAVLTHKNKFAGRSKLYSRTSDMLTDGYLSTDVEVRAVKAILRQPTHPTKVLLIKATTGVTQVTAISITSVQNLATYPINVDGEGMNATSLSFASDSSATNDEIATGLVTALNGVANKNYTAALVGSVGAKTITITGNTPTAWTSVEVPVESTDLMKIAQTHADGGIDTELDAIAKKDNSWYWLVIPGFQSQDYVLTVADWVEENQKALIVDVNDSDAVTTPAVSGTDTLAALNGLKYTRTMGCYHPSPADMMSAGLEGVLAPKNVGRWTAKGKTIIGTRAVALSPDQTQKLLDRRANSYTTEAGIDLTWEGTVANTTYLFLDVVVCLDYVRARTIESYIGVQASLDIINYTDEDLSIIQGAIYSGVILDCLSAEHKIMAPGNPADPGNDPAPSFTMPRVADVDPQTRALREVPDCEMFFRLAGAAHKIFVTATVVF